MNSLKIKQLLEAKEKHYLIQKRVFKKYHQPIVTINLNIPGLNKQQLIYQHFFQRIKNDFLLLLQQNSISYQVIAEKNDFAGNFLIIILAKNLDCAKFKKILIEKELTNSSYQIVDIDLYNQTNQKISRVDVNYPMRKCYLCSRPAKVCTKEKHHDLNLLLAHINTLLVKELNFNKGGSNEK